MIRVVSMANFLSQHGMETHVLATRRAESQRLLNVDPAVQLHWVFGLIEYFGGKPKNRILTPLYWIVAALRLALSRLRPAWYIDSSSVDVRKFTAAAVRLCEKHQIRHVVISSPPHSLQQVGIELKRRLGPKLQYIADMRDGWTIRTMYQPNNDTSSAAKRQADIEYTMFDTADFVTLATSGLRRAYLHKYPRSKHLEVVANGFDDARPYPASPQLEALAQAARREGKLVLGYFGSATIGYSRGHKDLAPIIRAISDDPLLARGVVLIICGYIELKLMALPPNVIVFDVVPPDQARANMRQVDVGVVVHSDAGDAPMVMGGKVYEYAASGIPIWIVAPPNAHSLIEFVNATRRPLITNIEQSSDIRAHASQLISENKDGSINKRRFSQSEAGEFSRAAQYSNLLQLLR